MSSFQPQESGASKPCAAGCSFFGSPATHGMYSICYKKHHRIASASTSSAVTPGAAKPAAVAPPAASVVSFAPAKGGVAEAAAAVPSSSAPEAVKKAEPSRCAACYKKVGLTGFVCRCKKTFCGRHRYAEEHGCAFDFRGAGRDTIARANPLVKGEKLHGKI